MCRVEEENEKLKKRVAELEEIICNLRERICEMLSDLKKK